MLFSLWATGGIARVDQVPETQWYFYEPESSKNTLNKRNRWRRTENLKLFLTLQKSAENENINFIRVSFFFTWSRSKRVKRRRLRRRASSQEIKISRQLQNFFLSLSLIVLIKTMTRNQVVGGWLRICEARKMKKIDLKKIVASFSSLDVFNVMDLSMIWFHLLLSEWPSCLSNHTF